VNKTLLAVCIWLALVSASYAQEPVTIKSASINYLTNPNQIIVDGTGFCHRNAVPRVTLAGTALTVTSCSDTAFTAKLPGSLAVGTYHLIVRNNTMLGTAGFDVAYGVGSVGPMGPQGPQGPQGPMGLTGPQGPMGNAGATGAQGPAGPAGAAGPAGPSGPTGPTGPQGPSGASSAFVTNSQNGPILWLNQEITVGSLSLPAGNFLVFGKLGVDFPSPPSVPSTSTQDLLCTLQSPAGTLDSSEVNVQAGQAADMLTAIPLQGYVSFDSPSLVSMVCNYTTSNNCPGCFVRSSSVGITAIQVDNLTPPQ